MILDQICKSEGRPLDGKQPFLDRNDLDPGRDLQAFGINVSRYFTSIKENMLLIFLL